MGSRGRLAGDLQVYGLRTFAALIWLGFEGDAHAFIEGANARALDSGDVNENVFAALVRGNKAEAFRLIEKLDRAGLPHAALLECPLSLKVWMGSVENHPIKPSSQDRHRGW